MYFSEEEQKEILTETKKKLMEQTIAECVDRVKRENQDRINFNVAAVVSEVSKVLKAEMPM
ncbi:hypothetical protein HYW46_03100 [Candidatus Daviesbacteria bacterium]|nr:hypothetical protein [Candidatus Daviesbacteria bacterium]